MKILFFEKKNEEKIEKKKQKKQHKNMKYSEKKNTHRYH